jgi:ABC-type branched-subunit amino acid transport system substrate-binding protein
VPRRHRNPLLALVLGLCLVAASCGQKSGVAGTDVAAGGGAAPAAGGAAPAEGGEAAAAAHEPGPDDTAGVTDEEIVIGIHAPVTGASPIPQTSFEVGKDIYWRFLADSAPDQLFGRTVRVVFRDDEFNPNRAVAVCREMVEEEGAFLLIGGGGADQITACAQYADGIDVPYLSAGVNEEGLADLSTYYATSLTYSEQAPLAVAKIQEQGLERIGVVLIDTPSFEDAHTAFLEAAEEAGIEIVVDQALGKTAAEAEVLAVVQELKGADVDGVYLLTSPVTFIGLANGARNQSYEPVWIGPGVTSGLNAVTTFGCPAVETGAFFSPFPQIDVIDELDPDFRPAYEQFGEGAEADDIGLALWALNKTLALMFEATGEELGRAAFMNTIESTESFDNQIYSPVVITPDDHFGGTGAHLLEADCEAKAYTTTEQFIEGGETTGGGGGGAGGGEAEDGESEGGGTAGGETEGGEAEGGETEGGETEG